MLPTAALASLLLTMPSADPPAGTVSMNTVAFLLGQRDFNVEYEQRVRDHLSAFASAEYLVRFNPLQFFAFTTDGLVLTVGARWFPRAHAPAGWFIGPRFQLASLSVYGTPTGGALGAGLGFEGGYTFIVFDHLVMSLGSGANGYWLYGRSASGERRNLLFAFPLLRLQVGGAF
jgi:hypothetical protein